MIHFIFVFILFFLPRKYAVYIYTYISKILRSKTKLNLKKIFVYIQNYFKILKIKTVELFLKQVDRQTLLGYLLSEMDLKITIIYVTIYI